MNISGEAASSFGAGRHLVVACPFSDPAQGAWSAKFIRVVLDAGYTVEFWGWDRNGDFRSHTVSSFDGEPGFTRRVLFKGGGSRSTATAAAYGLWAWRLLRSVLKTRDNAMFVAVSFDTGLPMAVASLGGKVHFLFADRDNISMSFRWPPPVRALLRILERVIVMRCSLHVLPGRSRWASPGPKERFLPNAPASGVLAAARQIASRNGYARGQKLTIYVNGWLVESRGIGVFLEAYRQCGPGELEVIIAGKDTCSALEQLVRMPGVKWLGKISAEESLANYFRSHFVFTYYDPAIEINTRAEPNKWEDCVATQTPFIVNSEVSTAERFIRRQACAHAPYHDASGLALLLRQFAADRSEWEMMQRSLSEFETTAWDTEMLRLLDGLPWNSIMAKNSD